MTVEAKRKTNRPKQDKTDYCANGEIAVGVIWFAFYLAILVSAVTSPILSNVITTAAR